MRTITAMDLVPSQNHSVAFVSFFCACLWVLVGCAPIVTKVDIEGDSLDAKNVRALATYMKPPGLMVCSTSTVKSGNELSVNPEGHLVSAWKIGNDPGKMHYKLLMSFCGMEYTYEVGK